MENKVSGYNIEVDYCNGVLLYNTLTNKLLPVSFEDYTVIETLMEHLPEFEVKFPRLYQAFLKSGFIVPFNFDELAYIKLQNKRCVFMNRDYHLTVNPTLDCNLKCWYCSVSYAGAKHNKERMSDDMVESLKKHIEFLGTRQKANSILLDWFGGEPLMYFDEVIRKISDTALRLSEQNKFVFRQQMTTNATLLDEDKIRYMKDAHFRFLQISIDGNEYRQNLIKHYANKRGSYRDVISNINLLTEIIPDISICLRINCDRQTLKHVTDVINDFTEQSKKCITVDFQRVWQVPCTDEMRRQLANVKATFESEGFASHFWAYRPLTFKCCYADNINHYVVNYNGKIFKCTARDYGDELMIGNLSSSGQILWNDSLLSKMFEKSGFENDMCEKCKMLPICMGPCIQKNYERRINNQPVVCMYDNVEYSLSSYITDQAKQRQLIPQ
ncbi:radical SAM/SPASM domain-containing protein [Bacteroides stercorirosoris]|uniref:Radical SAM core domain-containing protein n=1 Tax=Bacteroides stercorirosoris TaxID=871324 RepID=A0A1M6L7M6_9BACE|nr:radical SAM protein [Bacteroides stercorirosoris]SHJ67206.1 uncharacterized protein SAMN05444350_1457 [Bacteroides stercorirosoris]